MADRGILLAREHDLNLVGVVLGFPLGFLLVWYMTVVYNTEMFRFPLEMPPKVWFKTMASAVVFGLLAHVFVQRACRRWTGARR